ncbi:MAG: HAD-IA family hydrolase, partial [Gammaproteobacteria bacterium]
MDTAPDLVAVLNRLLLEEGRAPVPYAIARNVVSHGALGMIRLGFNLAADASVSPKLRDRFLTIYAGLISVNSRLFITLQDLDDISSRLGARWGIVTNKPAAFTLPLVSAMQLSGSVAVVVSGDTLPQRKPDPAPLLLAARELGLEPQQCIYLGDA